VLLATLSRIGAALEPAHSLPLLAAAAMLWAAAFLGFGLAYGPILVRRVRGDSQKRQRAAEAAHRKQTEPKRILMFPPRQTPRRASSGSSATAPAPAAAPPARAARRRAAA